MLKEVCSRKPREDWPHDKKSVLKSVMIRSLDDIGPKSRGQGMLHLSAAMQYADGHGQTVSRNVFYPPCIYTDAPARECPMVEVV